LAADGFLLLLGLVMLVLLLQLHGCLLQLLLRLSAEAC
jgi:hypothetical protein